MNNKNELENIKRKLLKRPLIKWVVLLVLVLTGIFVLLNQGFGFFKKVVPVNSEGIIDSNKVQIIIPIDTSKANTIINNVIKNDSSPNSINVQGDNNKINYNN